eukprot:793581-Prymnesium_polylepis.1
MSERANTALVTQHAEQDAFSQTVCWEWNSLFGRDVWRALHFSKGDVTGFFQLFFDNLATTIALSTLLFSNNVLTETDIYSSFVPGLGLSMVFGNVYYAWMGCRLANAEKRNTVTCNPYGINTPGAYAFLFGVMIPVARDGNHNALHIACAANFVQGALAAVIGLAGPWIARVCPTASLVASLGGVGL